MNMLAIIRNQGLVGLHKATKDPRQILPVLTALGVAPALYQQASGVGAPESGLSALRQPSAGAPIQ